jgi:membrane-associated phospholipid phosphatase
MKSLLKENRITLFFLFLLLLAAFTILLTTDKINTHLQINSFVNRYLFIDFFFKYITYLGDGLLILILSCLVLFFNIRLGFALLVSYGIASLISTTLKHWVFPNMNRPFFVFQWLDKRPLKLVEGVDMYIHNSFPSGHATAAFVFFMTLSFFLKSKTAKVTCVCIAGIAAFSRVYLSQHFLMDITGGAILGSSIAIIVAYFFFYKGEKGFLSQWDRSIFKK